MFVSLEGPEGAGKSTQAKRLAQTLMERGHEVVLTREPGGTALGDGVRTLVLNSPIAVNPVAEFLLFSASRSQLVHEILRPALGRGAIVIVDRYSDSSLAYQGFGRGLNLDWLNEVTWEATGGLWPDITVLLDLPPQLGLQRSAARGSMDRLEQDGLAFHEKVRGGFLSLAAQEPERWLVLDATRPQDDLALEIATAVTSALPPSLPESSA
jgi:dTMP kinase